MKIKVWVSVLVFALFVCTGNLAAKERRGAELVIQKVDGQLIRGELIAVRQNSLLLLSSEGADLSIEIKDVRQITIVKKSKVLARAGYGILIGGGLGALLGLAGPIENEPGWSLEVGYVAEIALALGAIGLAVGTTIDLFASVDKMIGITGRPDAEIQEILEKLRRQARVTNAQ